MESTAAADAVDMEGCPASTVAVMCPAKRKPQAAAADQQVTTQTASGIDWMLQGDDLLIENVPRVVVEHHPRSGRATKPVTLQEHPKIPEDKFRAESNNKKRQEREDEGFNIESSPGSLPEDELWGEHELEEPPLPPSKKQRQSGKDKGARSGHKASGPAASGRVTSSAAVSIMGCRPTGGGPSGKAVRDSGSKATAPKASGATQKARQSAPKASGAAVRASARAAGALADTVKVTGAVSGAAGKASGAKHAGRKRSKQQQRASTGPSGSCVHADAQPSIPEKASSQQPAGLDASFMEPDVPPQDIQVHQPGTNSQQQGAAGLSGTEAVWGGMVFTCAAPAVPMQHDPKAAGKASGKTSGSKAGRTSGKLASKAADVPSGKGISQASGNIASKASFKKVSGKAASAAAAGKVAGAVASGRAARRVSAGNSKQESEVEPMCAIVAHARCYQQVNAHLVEAAMQQQLPAAFSCAVPAVAPVSHRDEVCRTQPSLSKPHQPSLLYDPTNACSAPRNPKLAAFAALCKARTAAAEATAAANASDSRLDQERAAVMKSRASGGARTSGGGAVSGGPACGPGLAGGMFACPQTAKYRGPGLRRPAGKSSLLRRR